MLDPSSRQIIMFRLLASRTWHVQCGWDWIQRWIFEGDWLFETHFPLRNSPNPLQHSETGWSWTVRRHKGFRTPPISAFIALRGWGRWDWGDEVWGLLGRKSRVNSKSAAICITFFKCCLSKICGFSLCFPENEAELHNRSQNELSWRVGRQKLLSQAIRTTAEHGKACPLGPRRMCYCISMESVEGRS